MNLDFLLEALNHHEFQAEAHEPLTLRTLQKVLKDYKRRSLLGQEIRGSMGPEDCEIKNVDKETLFALRDEFPKHAERIDEIVGRVRFIWAGFGEGKIRGIGRGSSEDIKILEVLLRLAKKE